MDTIEVLNKLKISFNVSMKSMLEQIELNVWFIFKQSCIKQDLVPDLYITMSNI